MLESLRDLLIAAATSGIVGILADRQKGGVGKAVSLVCSLVLLFYLLSPIVALIENGNFDFPVPSSISYALDEKGGDELIKRSEDLISTREKNKIQKKYSLSEDDFSLTITLSADKDDSSLSLTGAVLYIKSIRALAWEKDIVSLLRDDLLTDIKVIEDI